MSDGLKGVAEFYIGRTILGSPRDDMEDSLLLMGLKQAKYTPFYTAAFFGSTTLLILGLAFLSYGLGLVIFQGMSSTSDICFFAGSLLSIFGLGLKFAIYFAIRKKERKLVSLKKSAENWGGIANIFLETFARELKKEQKQFANDLVETEEFQEALRRFDQINPPASGNPLRH